MEPVTLICDNSFDNFYIVEEKVQYENTKDYVNTTNVDKGCMHYIHQYPSFALPYCKANIAYQQTPSSASAINM